MMYRISVNHNKVPVPTLEKWNNIEQDAVRPGMHLIVGYLKVKTALSRWQMKPHRACNRGQTPATDFTETTTANRGNHKAHDDNHNPRDGNHYARDGQPPPRRPPPRRLPPSQIETYSYHETNRRHHKSRDSTTAQLRRRHLQSRLLDNGKIR